MFGPLFPSVSLLTDVPPQPRAGPRRAAVPGRASSRLRGSPTADRGTARPPPTYSLAPPRGRPRTQPGAGGGGGEVNAGPGAGGRDPRCPAGPRPRLAPRGPPSAGLAESARQVAPASRAGDSTALFPPPNPPPASARAGPHVARAPVKSRQPPRARHWRRQRPPARPPRSSRCGGAGPPAPHPGPTQPLCLPPPWCVGSGLRILPARRAGIPQPRGVGYRERGTAPRAGASPGAAGATRHTLLQLTC